MAQDAQSIRNQKFVPDPEQDKAINHVHGPMLVLAGAGTGKTTVLTRRIAALIANGHARPDEILALTYTLNAAHELHERVAKLLAGRDTSKLQTRTFHSYCEGVLERAGKNFGLVDDNDLWIYLRRRIQDLPLERFIKAARIGVFLHDLREFFARCHDEVKSPADYEAYLRRVESGEYALPRVVKSKQIDEVPREESIARCREIAAVFHKVEEMLEVENLGTYSHQITRALKLLQSDPALLKRERAHARFILIDEFQDSNVAQIKLVQLLAGDEANVFAVGDPDQAIYRFRGATSGAFDSFIKMFGASRKIEPVMLRTNRRSTPSVLRCAFAAISQNPEIVQEQQGSHVAFKRELLTSGRAESAQKQGKKLPSPPVEVVVTQGSDAVCCEAAEVADSILKYREQGATWSDFAVIYRQHSHRDALLQEFDKRQIPFSVKGVNVLETSAVRDVLSAVRAIESYGDSVALFRLAALPQFHVDPDELRQALAVAGRKAQMHEVLAGVRGGESLLKCVGEGRGLAKSSKTLAAAVVDIAIRVFQLPRTAEVEALREFVKKWAEKPITKTGQLVEFLEYLDYFEESGGKVTRPESEDDDKRDAVRLMTVHGAKGLEFPHVYVLRLNSGSFPKGYGEPLFEFPQEMRDPITVPEGDGKKFHDEEERRLFYVAITRAKDTLMLLAREGRGKDKTPAGYLRPMLLDRSLADVLNQTPAKPMALSMEAAAAEPAVSKVGEWLQLRPRMKLDAALSATAIDTYDNCPLRFKLERDWHLPGEVVPAMQFGHAMHTAMKAYYDSVKVERVLPLEGLLDCFFSAMSDEKFEDELQRALYEREGRKELEKFYEARQKEPMPSVMATERPFRVKIGDATLIGRMDRIDRLDGNKVAIVDFKTGSPKSQEDADKSLQLSVYAIAAQAEGFEPAKLAFYNLETNLEVETIRDGEELNKQRQKVQEVALAILNEQFDAKPGFHCRWCGFRTICPETEEVLASGVKKAAGGIP